MGSHSAPVQRGDCWTDCRRLGDGSGRWLWAVYCRAALWSAGVCASYEDCHPPMAEAWLDLLDHHGLLTVLDILPPPVGRAGTLDQFVDLNQLGEPGEAEDAPPVDHLGDWD